jgi:periplasmic divalent cation tolerance protein
VLLVKTTESKAAEATRRIKELHGYECPCVAALSISPGNQEYFDWIEAETTDEK